MPRIGHKHGQEITPEEIQQSRLRLGLKQTELGVFLTTTQHAISHWERGNRQPEHPGMLRLALVALRFKQMHPQLFELIERDLAECITEGIKITVPHKTTTNSNA